MELFTPPSATQDVLPTLLESPSTNRLRRGFTLVEIAIVLVIIGLIVGGVLVGADLIKVAKLRNAASELDKISAAVNTFKTKYNCTPGDCPIALNYFPSAYSTYGACTGNGDGNGLIDQWPCETNMALAGLIAAGFMFIQARTQLWQPLHFVAVLARIQL